MKKLIYILLMLCYGCTPAFSQSSAKISAAFWAKYPEQPSSYCDGCTIDINPYFSCITDNKLGYSVVSYGNFTPQKESLVVTVKVDRKKFGGWHAYPGQLNEDKYYVSINKAIRNSLEKYAKGHYVAYILCAVSIEGAVISCTYKVNEGLENQGQNEGTELDIENLTRVLVGSKSSEVNIFAQQLTKADTVNYSIGQPYEKIDFWKGGWYDKQDKSRPVMVSANNMSRVFCDVYWNLIEYGGHVHAFWFPNNISASSGFETFEISVETLIQRLGFDPRQRLSATN